MDEPAGFLLDCKLETTEPTSRSDRRGEEKRGLICRVLLGARGGGEGRGGNLCLSSIPCRSSGREGSWLVVGIRSQIWEGSAVPTLPATWSALSCQTSDHFSSQPRLTFGRAGDVTLRAGHMSICLSVLYKLSTRTPHYYPSTDTRASWLIWEIFKFSTLIWISPLRREKEPRNAVCFVDYHYHSLKFVFSHHDFRMQLMISTIIFYIFGGELSVESYILRWYQSPVWSLSCTDTISSSEVF